MNRRAAASVRAVKRELLSDPPADLLLFVIFGSQVRNTQTPESDPDILYITRTNPGKFSKSLCRTLAGTRGGVRTATVFEHTSYTIGRNANLYGSPEYHALRGHRTGESRILYRSPRACRALDPLLAAGVGGCPANGHNDTDICDTEWCADWYLRISALRLSAGRSWARSTDNLGPNLEPACNSLYDSIGHSVKACLLSRRIMFPYARDIRDLYRLLPPDCRPVPGLDLDALHHWGARRIKLGSRMYTPQDAAKSVHAARRMYSFASKTVRSARRAKPTPRRPVLDAIRHVPTHPNYFTVIEGSPARAPSM